MPHKGQVPDAQARLRAVIDGDEPAVVRCEEQLFRDRQVRVFQAGKLLARLDVQESDDTGARLDGQYIAIACESG